MHRFDKSDERWWQKPLVMRPSIPLPAELVVLRAELQAGEAGVWLNSRNVTSGVVDLVRDPAGKLRTVRAAIPAFGSTQLKALYEATGLTKGAPDLIVWHNVLRRVRFIEVKCPHWDTPSDEQRRFLRAAEAHGLSVAIVEWEFCAE